LTLGGSPSRDLRALFEPQSVAIVGASANPAKWGYWLGNSALKGRHRRRVYLVNRAGGTLLGERAYRSLEEIGQPVELVVIAVSAAGFESAVDDALQAGARALVAITAGLGETGEAGRAVEQRVAERVRAAGAVLVGPNCLGIADTGSDLDLASQDFPRGAIGLISQSGNLTLELALLAAQARVGFSRVVSVGNQADLDTTALIDAFRQHDDTQVIAVYVEDFRDGRRFAQAAESAVRGGKPVILLTVGQSRAAARAARSHTGALVSESIAVDAACRASGMVRVHTTKDIVDLAQAFLMPDPVRGRRVGVVGDGGGHVALAADQLVAHGLELPELSQAASDRIRAVLPPTAATRNPVDMAGGGEQDFRNYARVVSLLAESGDVDAVLLTGYFGGYSGQSDDFRRLEMEVAEAMARSARARECPLIVQTMYPASPPMDLLRQVGVPVYADIEGAARALGRLARRRDEAPTGVPELPQPDPRGALEEGYFEARELLTRAGVPFIDAQPVRSLAEARAAGAAVGFPVVLKALAATHKSDSGGVRLDIRSDEELTRAFTDMAARLRPALLSVEPMAPLQDGIELLIGVRRDRRFGPVALAGFGGLDTEVFHDVATALAPVTHQLAESLIRSLRSGRLLLGTRGRPPLHLAGAADALVALSELAAGRPEIAEVEINPLLVLPDRVVALDARLVVDHET
jgi:acyl-CoA synthetase (NDP forming)